MPGASLAAPSAAGAAPGTTVLVLDEPMTASKSVRQGAEQTVTGVGFGAARVSAQLRSSPTSLGR